MTNAQDNNVPALFVPIARNVSRRAKFDDEFPMVWHVLNRSMRLGKEWQTSKVLQDFLFGSVARFRAFFREEGT